MEESLAQHWIKEKNITRRDISWELLTEVRRMFVIVYVGAHTPSNRTAWAKSFLHPASNTCLIDEFNPKWRTTTYALNEDFAYPDTSAHLTKTCFHGLARVIKNGDDKRTQKETHFSCSEDRDATDLALETDTIVGRTLS